MMMIMRCVICNEQTNKYDLQAMLYTIICSQQKLHSNGNKNPAFPGSISCIWYYLAEIMFGFRLWISHYIRLSVPSNSITYLRNLTQWHYIKPWCLSGEGEVWIVFVNLKFSLYCASVIAMLYSIFLYWICYNGAWLYGLLARGYTFPGTVFSSCSH